MKKVLLSGLLMFGCSDPSAQTCEEAEMPTVSEVVPEDQIVLPTKSVLLLDYSGVCTPLIQRNAVRSVRRSHF